MDLKRTSYLPNKFVLPTTINRPKKNNESHYKILKKEKTIQTDDPSVTAYLYSNMLTDVNHKLKIIYKK